MNGKTDTSNIDTWVTMLNVIIPFTNSIFGGSDWIHDKYEDEPQCKSRQIAQMLLATMADYYPARRPTRGPRTIRIDRYSPEQEPYARSYETIKINVAANAQPVPPQALGSASTISTTTSRKMIYTYAFPSALPSILTLKLTSPPGSLLRNRSPPIPLPPLRPRRPLFRYCLRSLYQPRRRPHRNP